MACAVQHSEGLRIYGGLKKGCTVPFFIGEVCRNFGLATLFGEKQVPYCCGVIPQLISGPMPKSVVPHGLERLTQSVRELIQHDGGKLEIIQLLVSEGLQ